MTEERVNKLVTQSLKHHFVEMMLQSLMGYDVYTYAHSLSVAKKSVVFAEYISVPDEEMNELVYAALLHDIGKIMVPQYIILKKEPLTDIEFEQIKMHPLMGANLIKKTTFFSNEVVNGVLTHHENFDGSGYISGYMYDEIGLYGKILRLADSFDALMDDRPYRPGYTKEAALKIIEKGAGKEYDPFLCKKFINCFQ